MFNNANLVYIYTYVFKVFAVHPSSTSNSIISPKDCSYQLLTKLTDGIFNRLSGSKWISFMILAKRTGSSFFKNWYDFCSSAFKPVEWKLINIFCLVLVSRKNYIRKINYTHWKKKIKSIQIRPTNVKYF